MTYKQALWKRKIESIFAWPIVILGKWLSPWCRPRGNPRIFIFCPSADIGGANLINVDLLNCIKDQNPQVIFSKRPKDNLFLDLFQQTGVPLWDLHHLVDYKWYHFINIFYRGVLAAWVNKKPEAVVIGGESLYFHKVLPWLDKEVRSLELSHLGTWFPYTQSFLQDIDVRIFSTKRLQKDAEEFYQKQHIPEKFFQRLIFIESMLSLSEEPLFEGHEQMEVIFIGRGSPQKRVYLIAKIAREMHQQGLPVHFAFAGNVSNIIRAADYPYCTFYGNVKERSKLQAIRRKSDVLLLTSAFEGLPVVVMEMMGEGKAIVSTAVNAIPDYIKDGENGFLIPNHKDEQQIVSDGVEKLKKLSQNRELLQQMGHRNRAYALSHFGKDRFCRDWKRVIEEGKWRSD